MAEPKLEEGEVSERETKPKDESNKSSAKGNPLQNFLSRKVKIAGREIPLPLIVLGALGIGIVLFSIINRGKGRGVGLSVNPDEGRSLGTSEGVSDRVFSGGQKTEDELTGDLGEAFTPIPIEPLPVSQPFTPAPIAPLPDLGYAPLPSGGFSTLPVPQLPYADFGSGMFQPEAPQSFGYPEQEPMPLPSIRQPITPIDRALPIPGIQRPPGRGINKPPEGRIGRRPGVQPKPTPDRPSVGRRPPQRPMPGGVLPRPQPARPSITRQRPTPIRPQPLPRIIPTPRPQPGRPSITRQRPTPQPRPAPRPTTRPAVPGIANRFRR